MATVEHTETNALETSAQSIVAKVAALEVNDDFTFAQAKEYGLAAKELESKINDATKDEIAQAHARHKELTKARNDLLAPIKKVKDLVALKCGAYHERLEREAAEEARIAAALAAKEREAEIQETTDALIETGNTAAAAEHLRHAESLPEIHVAPEVHRPEAAKGGTTRKVYKFEVVDESLLPREYLMPDMKAIGAFVRAKKGAAQIPGVKTWVETKHHV